MAETAETLSPETSKESRNVHPRLADYKARSTRCSQEERRFNLLLEQKERRSDSFNESRGLLEAIASKSDGDDLVDDEMEWSKIGEEKHAVGYFDRLMLSEWLIEIPGDLSENWYMVPCPKGRRTLVVAARGSTRSYNKYGCHMATFRSLLPGGHSGSHGSTILDCIWHPQSKTYYILDVLAWNNQPLLDCETEFRFFWLQSKIPETEGIAERCEGNQHPFILLPHYHCEAETLTTIMAMFPPFPDEKVVLDGLLFYHTQCHYKCGSTPLVGWLKPFMVPEVLKIPVADEYLAMIPEGYKSLMEHIEQQAQEPKPKKPYKKKKRKSHSKQEKMEVTVSEEEPCES